METVLVLLDKQYTSELPVDLGKIGVRVVVFNKKEASGTSDEDQPLDLDADEDFSVTDSEVNSFLELPKRGKLCCVFLINGQRHHALDNAFIVTDLKMKYLRKRMILIVDLDGLSQRATAEIMQGSRSGLFEGEVYHKIRERLVATLQNDPDLKDLEEEAEEELSQLQSGDAAVQEALDQLIESHFEQGDRSSEGSADSGGNQGSFFAQDGTPVNVDVVIHGSDGEIAIEPVLVSNIESPVIRIRPKLKKKFFVTSAPGTAWPKVSNISPAVDPPVNGLECITAPKGFGTEISLYFEEPAGFDAQHYPIETTLRVIAAFEGSKEWRLLEKEIVIRPRKKTPPPPPRTLKDVPTFLKIASRQPVRLLIGAGDAHVKIVWDGADYLTFDPNPTWTFTGVCTTHSNIQGMTFTKPTQGRFEALIPVPADAAVGTKMQFEIKATGPADASLVAVLVAEIVEPPGARKQTIQAPLRSERRPPYKIQFVFERDFGIVTRWGAEETWNAAHAASFIEPTESEPLRLCINQDFGLLRNYLNGLVAKKADEQRAEEKKTKYTSHVAYHLYQMYMAKDELKKKKEANPGNQPEVALREPQDDEMQSEINRVASTLIRLMEVTR
jgi:hypothetical protein